MKIPWERLHHAFLTHEHTDHILGMVWAVRYVTELILYGNYEGNFTVFSNAVAGLSRMPANAPIAFMPKIL